MPISPKLLADLLDIGHSENFDRLAEYPDFQRRHSASRFLSDFGHACPSIVESLSAADLLGLVKSLVAIETHFGGFGSVTCIAPLLRAVPDPDFAIMDWVLRHYPLYYYSLGATNGTEYAEAVRLKFLRKRANTENERLRETAAKERAANTATQRLYNAVRRGDRLAVSALVSKGADVNVATPGGVPLVEYAIQLGQPAIVEILKRAQYG